MANQQQQIEAFKRLHLSDQTNPSVPKSDKILEWTLFNIMETLHAINGNLARIANQPRG
jgi:hypothetical protein